MSAATSGTTSCRTRSRIEVLTRVLEAAHTAPSVGFSQPWDFLVLRDEETPQRRPRARGPAAGRATPRRCPRPAREAFARAEDRGDPRHPGQHRRHLRPDPRRPAHARPVHPAADGAVLHRPGGREPVARRARRGPRRRLGLVLRRARAGRGRSACPSTCRSSRTSASATSASSPASPSWPASGWARRRPLAWAVHEEQYGRRALPGRARRSTLLARPWPRSRGWTRTRAPRPGSGRTG